MTSGGTCVELTGIGGPEMLQVVDKPEPLPAAGEIRVRIKAAGVAFADVKMRHGIYPGAPSSPFVPGYDFAGVVDAVGSRVKDYAVGDHVAGLSQTGSYATYLTLKPRHVAKMPKSVDFAPAAASVLNYITAYQLINRCARAKAGQTVLVHGGAGGVGTALLDLLRGMNIKVYATASKAKHDLVRSYGAEPIDYQAQDFVKVIKKACGHVDAVFDHVGGDHLWASRKVLSWRGILVCYGFAGAVKDGHDAAIATLTRIMAIKALPGPRATFYGILSPGFSFESHIAADLGHVLRLLGDGSITPHIGMELPLTETAQAHQVLEDAGATGKIVLTV